ncbi:MAG: acylphosphatase [Elusimicrobia bacterium]|nr:acylphosphatase [Elusimicrobiota bacterium]
MKRLQLLISGRVQGVGFRWFVRETATSVGASGWVKNESDGTVSAEAQAPEEILEELLRQLHAGNGWARVKEIRAAALPVSDNETGFEIRT